MTRFDVAVKPRSKKEGVDVAADGSVVVRVRAPPVEGAANDTVVEVVAAKLGLKRRDVRIVVGETGRKKVLEVDGLTLDEVMARLR